ncbi:MAG TPA: NAD(P)H-hydrate dehydratase, partial [Flavipsychrobacter sp.]|nr:NAD(P)H-hydrate dehydratase [Flavipsychrobacter sp.]
GGDGLAITRLLHGWGYGAKAFLVQVSEVLSEDCATNLKMLRDMDAGLVAVVEKGTFLTDIPPHVVVVDAILGTGLNRPMEGWVAEFVGHVNELPNRKVAIDIPSGMPADTVAQAGAAIVRVDDTVSFQFYKRAFLHGEMGVYAGRVHLLDIGLSETFINATHSNYHITDRAAVGDVYKPREPFTHKGSYGIAMIVGGSYGMMGAVALSVCAALRSGGGRVRSVVPRCGYGVVQALAPEAMCTVSGEEYIKEIRDWESADAIGIGPGMGTNIETLEAFEELLDACKEPLVIDADALNLIGKKKQLLHKIPANSILTPHPREFERIFGATADSMLRLEHARTQAMRYNIIIVLKDRYTAIVTPEGECWYNITGNAGLATGGSGDVLTGIITALVAQKYAPVHAAMLGVYLHGVAAEKAMRVQSMESMIAGDVVDFLGEAFKELR